MINLNYKKLHENFIENAKKYKASTEEKGFGIDLMEAFSKAISKEITRHADLHSTPGYVNFCKDVDENKIVDKKLNREVIEALKKKKTRQAVEKKEKALETKDITKVDDQTKKSASSIKNLDKKEKQANQKTDELKDKEKFVYASKTGKKYHKKDCIYKKDSFDKMSQEKAEELGKTPCSTCFNK